MEAGFSNSQIAELLALEGERSEGHLRKACYHAAHAAHMWPVETVELLAEGKPLTVLPSIGPSLARRIATWQETKPEIPVPPEHRRNFLTLTQARAILLNRPEYRAGLHGDLQMHTEWSDGSGTVVQMAQEALERGYSFISITDHTKGLKIAGGINEEQLRAQEEEIQSVNKTLRKFRVLRSVEMNLSPGGEGDMEPESLDRLDIVLGSFHSQVRKTEDQTERYLAAIRNPQIQILGHPRGRVYNYRAGLKADWRRVFAEAARLGKAVEVDSYSDRQDLDVELLQLAREEGVMLSLGTDAHHPQQLAFMELGLAAVALAGIPKEQILNYKSGDELLEWVQEVREKSTMEPPLSRMVSVAPEQSRMIEGGAKKSRKPRKSKAAMT